MARGDAEGALKGQDAAHAIRQPLQLLLLLPPQPINLGAPYTPCSSFSFTLLSQTARSKAQPTNLWHMPIIPDSSVDQSGCAIHIMCIFNDVSEQASANQLKVHFFIPLSVPIIPVCHNFAVKLSLFALNTKHCIVPAVLSTSSCRWVWRDAVAPTYSQSRCPSFLARCCQT